MNESTFRKTTLKLFVMMTSLRLKRKGKILKNIFSERNAAVSVLMFPSVFSLTDIKTATTLVFILLII